MQLQGSPELPPSPSPESPGRRPRKSPWVARVEYGAAVALLAVLRRLPLGVVYGVSEALVRLLYRLPLRYRERALASIETAFGDRPRRWRVALLRRSLSYHAWFFADVLLGPRLLRDPRYADAVDLRDLDEALRGCGVLKERGALLVGSHQGTAEIGSLSASLRGWPHAAVARQVDNPLLWEMLIEERGPFPRPHLTKAGALRPARRILKSGGIVGLQIDQDAGPSGVFVPYFGIPASTHSGAAVLALTTGVPVFIFSCIRTAPRRFHYKVYCSGPLWAERTGDFDRDVQLLTARMTAEIETMARRFPEQVLWVHRRWKTRPRKPQGTPLAAAARSEYEHADNGGPAVGVPAPTAGRGGGRAS